MFFYHSECKNCCLYITIQKIALQAESKKCFQIWFSPDYHLGGKMAEFWACACKLSWTLFSPAWVQPLYGAGRKESSGIGLIDKVFKLYYSQTSLDYPDSRGLGWNVRRIESADNRKHEYLWPRRKLNNLEKSKLNFPQQQTKSELIKTQWNALY